MTRPHPPGSTHAIQFLGDGPVVEQACRASALLDCPQGLDYAIHEVPGGWEWYAPVSTPPFDKQDPEDEQPARPGDRATRSRGGDQMDKS